MDPIHIGLGGVVLVLLLIALRVPIAVALFSVSFGGLWIGFDSRMAFGLFSTVPYNFAASWTLSSVPLFLFMGFVAFHAGLTKGLFAAARAWLGVLPGGLAIASIFGASGFAAVTGSSVACAAAMGRIAIPEMLKSNYDKSIASGSVAAAGTIGALIPPSIILILFGIQAQVSIIKLFLGGLIIGLTTLAAYSLVVFVVALKKPDALPRSEAQPLADRMRALSEVWPVLVLIAAIFGGMFAGWFTATEAGAIGALLTVLLGFFRGVLDRKTLFSSAVDTLLAMASLSMVAIGANAFTRFIALTGVTTAIGDWVTSLELGQVALLLTISATYILLGMFLEPIGAMLLTLPIVLPLIASSGVPVLWFGILVAKLLEMGMITPPVGLNVFVIRSVVGTTIPVERIFRGAVWFLLADAVIVLLMIATRDVFMPLLG
jgi:tripartite ATP-independent transporter DctM subunit